MKCSCAKYLHFWSDIFLKSCCTWPNKTKFNRKHLWKVLYNISSFHTDWTKTMITMGNSCFWLAEILKKNSLLKLGGTMNFYFVWMMYWRSCTKFLYFVPILQLIWKFLFKKSSLKTFGQINWNLVGSTYGRFCIKVPENDRWATQAQPSEPLVLWQVSDTGSALWTSSLMYRWVTQARPSEPLVLWQVSDTGSALWTCAAMEKKRILKHWQWKCNGIWHEVALWNCYSDFYKVTAQGLCSPKGKVKKNIFRQEPDEKMQLHDASLWYADIRLEQMKTPDSMRSIPCGLKI